METIQTTRTELKEPIDASLVYSTSAESFNAKISDEFNKDDAKSKFGSHLGSEYNLNQKASMSRIFVLSDKGKPLTPCKSSKARKLICGGVAKVVWNKFGEFGIQMLIPTRGFVPKTVLGIDNGTKFEGYSLIVGKENLLNIMWLLPNKKTLVNKLTK